MDLVGSCKCKAVLFRCKSHCPVPYLRCYCSICRKTAGTGGYAINIQAQTDSLEILNGKEEIRTFRAMVPGESGGALQPSTSERKFCRQCGSFLWVYDPTWPQWINPFAGAIDTDLPKPPLSQHIMLGSKANWVEPQIGPQDETFDEYPTMSLEEFHKKHKLFVA